MIPLVGIGMVTSGMRNRTRADEAPPVQPVTQPVETDEMEAARQRVALELPSIPPSELELEAEAIQADLDALIERRGSLSLAEFEKGIDDIVKRQNAWRGKWEETGEGESRGLP